MPYQNMALCMAPSVEPSAANVQHHRTAALLRQYLQEQHHLAVSRKSVSLAIARLGLRWKRPRYDLSRRSATWCQAKGGSSAGWRGGSGR